MGAGTNFAEVHCDDCRDGIYIQLSDHFLHKSVDNLTRHLMKPQHIAKVYDRLQSRNQTPKESSWVKIRINELGTQATSHSLYRQLKNLPHVALDKSTTQTIASQATAASRPSTPVVPSSRLSNSETILSEDDIDDRLGLQKISTPAAEPVPKETTTGEYKLVLDGCIEKVAQHSATIESQAKTLEEQKTQVQQTMQMLGDVFDTHAAQSTAIERLGTDTNDWIMDLEKENMKQKATIDRLRSDLRQHKDAHKEFVRSTETRFERMAQDNEAQMELVMESIQKAGGGIVLKDNPQAGNAIRVSPRKRARQM